MRNWKIVDLTQGIFALVDNEDFDRIASHKWQAFQVKGTWYAQRRGNSRNETVLMHRLILNPPDGLEVDHIKHHEFYIDNRKKNLRLASRAENSRNTRKKRNASSSFKGVCWVEDHKKWKAVCHTRGKNYFLGYFSTEQEAAKAYNEGAKKHFGEFALLNTL